jgi:hypothetical protein
MLLARRADLQTPNSTRERTDCTSLPATPVALVAVLLPSRLVSLPRSARGGDNKVRGWIGSGHGITKCSHNNMLQGTEASRASAWLSFLVSACGRSCRDNYIDATTHEIENIFKQV